jgi:hypothetical protein
MKYEAAVGVGYGIPIDHVDSSASIDAHSLLAYSDLNIHIAVLVRRSESEKG